MSETAIQTQVAAKPVDISQVSGVLQRQCDCGQHTENGGECEECKKKRERRLQRAAVSPSELPDVPPSVQEALSLPGRPLEADTRASMESRFGYDFSSVRVHTDPKAAASAQAVHAHAYTVGRDLVFAPSQYQPEKPAGYHLLAHELVHVMQQSPFNPSTSPDVNEISRRSDPSELEAERIANGDPAILPGVKPEAGVLHRFEAPVHEMDERAGLTAGGVMTNEEASATYFGNWMRDINQLFVPTVTNLLPADVIFSLISYMAATKFGRELTPEQLGYYIPAEHIDNPGGQVDPKGQAHPQDLLPSQPTVSAAAQPPDPGRLGAKRPSQLDTPQEDINPTTGTVQGVNIFAVDQTGVMAYIRRTNLHIERRLQLAADIGRNPEGLQHFGAALHAVEDLFAHSNYVEIAVDRLLRNDSTFLSQLTDSQDRQVFNYAPPAQVGGGGAPSQDRPVLTTGTFTGKDTLISIASIAVGLLSNPLPEPKTKEETAAQDRFMVALLRNFESRLRSNPQLLQTIRKALRDAGIPEPIANHADQVPLADIYRLHTFLRIPIPDKIRIPLKRAIRQVVSEKVLQPVSSQIQSAAQEARMADTSLIKVLRESQREQSGQFTQSERTSMQRKQMITGESVAQQEAETRAEGGARAQAIKSTPIHVVAGPSHSQISKDHPNSPFFGLAFLLAYVAVERLRDRMLAAWAERSGSPSTPFNFDLSNFPQAAPAGLSAAQTDTYEEARKLYHDGRPGRGTKEKESLQKGQEIISQGGQPGQSYDLAAQRQQAANNIRAVVAVLQAIGKSPTGAAAAISKLRILVGRVSPETEQRLRQEFIQAQAAAAKAGASQAIANINTVATSLEQTAAVVEAASRHQQREQANAELVQRRSEMLTALANQPGFDSGQGTVLLYALDEEIQSTAVAYTSEQRAVLEGRQSVSEMGASPRGLSVQTLNLPAVTGSPATKALLNESRLLVAHPYDNTWWEQHVRTYAQRFPGRLINDIQARNEGVPFYSSAGGGHGHP
jgi:hypothetical protein